MTVSGVQQVLLHVKVMEVSRTKLRQLGFDFVQVNNGNMFVSRVSGPDRRGVAAASDHHGQRPHRAVQRSATPTARVLRRAGRPAQDSLAKILAEPNLVAVSGRPAYFQVGGEFGYQLSGGVSGPTVDVQGLRHRASTSCPSCWATAGSTWTSGPASAKSTTRCSVRRHPRLEDPRGGDGRGNAGRPDAGHRRPGAEPRGSQNAGLPWISEVPYLGVALPQRHEQINEVELLILVTPELVDADGRRARCRRAGRAWRPPVPATGNCSSRGTWRCPFAAPAATASASPMPGGAGRRHGRRCRPIRRRWPP